MELWAGTETGRCGGPVGRPRDGAGGMQLSSRAVCMGGRLP